MPSTEVISLAKKLQDWNGMKKCPKCMISAIQSKGKKYSCEACGFKMDKPKCVKCGSFKVRAINYYPEEIGANFICMNCANGGVVIRKG